MPKVVQFPDELLLHIFKAGCEIELEEDELEEDDQFRQLGRNRRRRKKFALYVQRVCLRWRRLVSGSDFWIVETSISNRAPQNRPPRLISNHATGSGRFAEQTRHGDQVADHFCAFQKAIVNSRGSDIRAGFALEPNNLPTWPSDYITHLKMLIYALRFLYQFRKQVVAISILVPEHLTCRYILQVLSKLRPLPRLTHLNISTGTFPLSYSIQELGVLQHKLCFEPLIMKIPVHHATAFGPLPLRSLDLSHSQLLAVFDLSHLSELHVEIGGGFGSQIELLSLLAGNRRIAESLQHLNIFIHSDILISEDPVSDPNGPHLITLNSLRQLCVRVAREKVAGANFQSLLRKIYSPVLTAIELVTLSPPNVAKNQVIPNLPTQAERHMKSLRILRVPFFLTHTGIQLLELFHHCHVTINTLEINGIWYPPLNEVEAWIEDRAVSIITQWSLRVLSIVLWNTDSWKAFIMCLKRLRIDSLEKLTVTASILHSISESPDLESVITTSGHLKSMYSLREITFATLPLSYILGALLLLDDAPSLQLISIKPRHPLGIAPAVFTRNSAERQILQLHPFPSIRSANIVYLASEHLDASVLFLLLDRVAPNVENVDITIYLDPDDLRIRTDPSSGDLQISEGEKILRWYNRALYRLQGRNIFSQMRHLHIRAFSQQKPSNIYIQEARKAIEEMCTLRKDAGALGLCVESFQLLYFDNRWLVEIFVSVLE